VEFVILVGLVLAFGIALSPNIFWIPLFLLLLLVCALGFGLWLSAVNVYVRDVQMLVPYLISLWQFASPVIYSVQSIPPQWKTVYTLNPMAGVIIGFRWCLLGTTPPGPEIWASVVVAVLVFLSGLMMFLRVQRTMVDIL
jgi:lipopolysaccharide transport system permease protein